MKTKIVIHENRVKIYFREGKHFIRYNTGIPVFGKSQFYSNDPQNYFNPISTEHIEYNKKLKLIQDLIEEIIDENLGAEIVSFNFRHIIAVAVLLAFNASSH